MLAPETIFLAVLVEEDAWVTYRNFDLVLDGGLWQKDIEDHGAMGGGRDMRVLGERAGKVLADGEKGQGHVLKLLSGVGDGKSEEGWMDGMKKEE